VAVAMVEVVVVALCSSRQPPLSPLTPGLRICTYVTVMVVGTTLVVVLVVVTVLVLVVVVVVVAVVVLVSMLVAVLVTVAGCSVSTV
jgi:hypothetical protein